MRIRRLQLVGCAWAFLIAGAAAQTSGPADSQDRALKEKLLQAVASTSLDMPGTRPWHLKLTIVKNPDDLVTLEETSVEEWWATPNTWRKVYTSPTHTYTLLHTEDGLFRSKDGPPPSPGIRLLLDQVVHPLPREDALDTLRLKSHPETVAGIAMTCITTTHVTQGASAKVVANPVLPRSSDYCFQTDRTVLRASRLAWNVTVLGTTMGTFQDRSVPTALLEQGPWGKIEAKVVKLGTKPLTTADFPVTNTLEKVNQRIGVNIGDVAAGSKIKGGNPEYPYEAKVRHISGSVVLYALIGTDGKIVTLQPLSSPDATLTRAAMNAVSRWEYRPYLMNGVPAEVETEIVVTFSISG